MAQKASNLSSCSRTKPSTNQKQPIAQEASNLSSCSRKSLFTPCGSNSSHEILETEPLGLQSFRLDGNQFLHSLKSKVEGMERAIHKIRYDVKEVLEMQQLLMKGQNQQPAATDFQTTEYLEFEKRFPLQNVDQITEFEASLENSETNKLMVNLINQIGGVTVEDCVKRTCVRLFTNEAASHYSWEGRKGKLSLNNMTLIKTIGRVLSCGPHKDAFTAKVFEFRLREWFRQAQTRMKGKKKVNNQPCEDPYGTV